MYLQNHVPCCYTVTVSFNCPIKDNLYPSIMYYNCTLIRIHSTCEVAFGVYPQQSGFWDVSACDSYALIYDGWQLIQCHKETLSVYRTAVQDSSDCKLIMHTHTACIISVYVFFSMCLSYELLKMRCKICGRYVQWSVHMYVHHVSSVLILVFILSQSLQELKSRVCDLSESENDG